MSSLHIRDPCQSSWLMSFSTHPIFTLWTTTELLSKALSISPRQDSKPDLHIHSFTLVISCNQTCFCSCSQAKGLNCCFTRKFLLPGSLPSELLQPGSSLSLYLCCIMTGTGNEYITMTTRLLACFLLSLKLKVVSNLFCKTLFWVSKQQLATMKH